MPQVERALGPHAKVDELALLTSQLALRGVRVDKPDGAWPAEAQLAVDDLTVDLALSALATEPRTIPKATLSGLYLAIVRRADGSTHVLPDLTEGEAEAKAASTDRTPVSIHIDDLELRDATLEFVDESMKERARIKLSHLSGHIHNLQLPGLEGKTGIELDGKVPGPRTTGTLELSGSIALSDLDSKTTLRMRGLDLAVFEPYLVKAMDTGVEHGTFDLRLAPRIHDRSVTAPGHIEIHGLTLAPSQRPGGSFLDMPRAAVVKALEGRTSWTTTTVAPPPGWATRRRAMGAD